jgi:hypothetical protein
VYMEPSVVSESPDAAAARLLCCKVGRASGLIWELLHLGQWWPWRPNSLVGRQLLR